MCADAWRTRKAAQAEALAAAIAEAHRLGQPCGVNACREPQCVQQRQLRKAKAAARPSRRKSASSPTSEQRRAELHGKGLRCGTPGCRNDVCNPAAAKRARAKAARKRPPKQ